MLFVLSINLITHFSPVLAISVEVDDAIVMVKAVHAKMAEEHRGALGFDAKVLDLDVD